MTLPLLAGPAASVDQTLRVASARLAAARVDAPRLVAEALLAQAISLSRVQLLARAEQPLSPDQLERYHALVGRCESGEPLAYVLGRREFYGLEFVVDRRVLIPRPETELLIETAIAVAQARSESAHVGYAIADIGTGSGAIAVTLAACLPQARVIATDVSPEALVVARENAQRHAVDDRVEFRAGDLLAPLDAPVDLIVANLPYIRSAECARPPHAIRRYEPVVALDGGPDGLELVRRLLSEAPRAIRPGGSILIEIGASHGDAAAELARDAFAEAAEIQVKADLAGLDRLLVIRTA